MPPHLVAEQVTAEARRMAGVPVALYLVDIDGTHLQRVAGAEEFPASIEAPLALGPKLSPEGVADLAERLAEQVPGAVPVPMWLRGRAIGLLLGLRIPRASLAELARQAAPTLELANAYTDVVESARRRKETNAASEIQQDLLPPRLVKVSGATLAGSVLPSYDVGGDFFDFADNRDGAWLAIADADGGARAAATSTVALGALRSARRRGASLEEAALTIDAAVRELGDPPPGSPGWWLAGTRRCRPSPASPSTTTRLSSSPAGASRTSSPPPATPPSVDSITNSR